MNKCKRCGSQFDVLYDMGGELRCIHCAIVNGGVTVKSLDELIAENADLRSQLAAARAERDALAKRMAAIDPMQVIRDLRAIADDEWHGKQGDWIKFIIGGDCGYISTLLHNVANSLGTKLAQREKPLTPDTEAT